VNVNKSLPDELNQLTSFQIDCSNKKSEKKHKKAQNPINPPNPMGCAF